MTSMTIMVSCKGFLNISTIKERILKYFEKDVLLNYPKDQFDLISVDVCYA